MLWCRVYFYREGKDNKRMFLYTSTSNCIKSLVNSSGSLLSCFFFNKTRAIFWKKDRCRHRKLKLPHRFCSTSFPSFVLFFSSYAIRQIILGYWSPQWSSIHFHLRTFMSNAKVCRESVEELQHSPFSVVQDQKACKDLSFCLNFDFASSTSWSW